MAVRGRSSLSSQRRATRVTRINAPSTTSAPTSVINDTCRSSMRNPNGTLRMVSKRSAVEISQGPMMTRQASATSNSRRRPENIAPMSPRPLVGHAEMGGKRAAAAVLFVGRGEERLGRFQQQIKRAEDDGGNDGAQRHERGEAGKARDQRRRQNARHDQRERMHPLHREGADRLLPLQLSEPRDQEREQARGDGREQGVGGDGDRPAARTRLVDRLQRDRQRERAGGPDQEAVEEGCGLVVELGQPAPRLLRGEQARPRHRGRSRRPRCRRPSPARSGSMR